MYQKPANNRRFLLPAAALVILLLALGIFGSVSNPYALSSTSTSTPPTLTDPAVLQNWLPASSYQDTLGRIDDYLTQHKLNATAMTVTGDVDTTNFVYSFKIELLPTNQSFLVAVTVNNDSPILTTTVSINGTVQSPTVGSAFRSLSHDTMPDVAVGNNTGKWYI